MPINPDRATVQNEGVQYELVPEGVYTAELLDIELKEGVEGKYGKKDKFYFKFAILDEEERATTIMHFTTTAYSAGYEGGSASKLYETACAIMGETLDDSLPLDVNTLIGGRMRIVVKHTQSNGKEYANVTEVMKADSAGKKLKALDDKEKPNRETMTDAEIAKASKKVKAPKLKGQSDLDDVEEPVDLDSIDLGK